jgi:hypothetical protein
VKGLQSAILGGLKPGSYNVRLIFCEPDGSEKLPVFSVGVNGDQIIGELNVVEKAGGVRRGYVLEATSVSIGEEGNLGLISGRKLGRPFFPGSTYGVAFSRFMKCIFR